MRSVPVRRPRRKPEPPPAAPFDFLTNFPDTARLLARWTNAVAILNTLSTEFFAIAKSADQVEFAAHLRPDTESMKRVKLMVLSAAEAAAAVPFRGCVGAIPEGGAA